MVYPSPLEDIRAKVWCMVADTKKQEGTIRTVGVVVKPNAPEAVEALKTLVSQHPELRFVAESIGYHALEELPSEIDRVEPIDFQNVADLVVVLGGDGTLIHASRLLQERAVPVLGINIGTIGFMTDVALDELGKGFRAAVAGELPYHDRMRLRAYVQRGESITHEAVLLNEVVLSHFALARLATYSILSQGKLVTRIRGDGVIAATPTGSTAYSLAAGGSILTPGIHAIAVTPISPQQLTQRQLIVDASSVLSFRVESESKVLITFDGQKGYDFHPGDELVVQDAKLPLRLLHVPWRSYFETLRSKLGWGDAGSRT